MRQTSSVIQDPLLWRGKVLNWLKQFDTFCFFDSSQDKGHPSSYDFLAGAGVKRAYSSSDTTSLAGFHQFLLQKNSWLFGHLGYELATAENIPRKPKEDPLQFPDIVFFEPEVTICLKNNQLQIFAAQSETVLEALRHTSSSLGMPTQLSVTVRHRMEKERYLQTLQQLQYHLHRGDCYEINFCQEFFAEEATMDPFALYARLNLISPTPFSALYRRGGQWLICASPERFLKKTGNTLISQPIKGTLARSSQPNKSLDQERQQLLNSEKEKAENVMIVDLVRNDLSRVCKEGSVQVEELFGIYSFAQVHQMISTITGQLEEGASFADIINATFPMGSMTGAPKKRVLELIEQYEPRKRGIYSGSVGYLAPNGDFDFNVVIRSLVYHAANKYLSWHTGSGITVYSNAEKEWEECRIKASAIEKVLKG